MFYVWLLESLSKSLLQVTTLQLSEKRYNHRSVFDALTTNTAVPTLSIEKALAGRNLHQAASGPARAVGSRDIIEHVTILFADSPCAISF